LPVEAELVEDPAPLDEDLRSTAETAGRVKLRP
jgi:hypothetical protein